MRILSAQYAITNAGPALKKPLISVGDDGTILEIEDTGGNIREKHSVEFLNGIIVPGFVNCHCHLELSHMKNSIGRNLGLTGFLDRIRTSRAAGEEIITEASAKADRSMYVSGVNLCADICNTPSTFDLKKESRISYINLLEVFGIDPLKAEHRMEEIMHVADIASEKNIPFFVVPHTVYSLSLTLFRLLLETTRGNRVTSLHFMEARGEAELVENHSGPLMDYYIGSGLLNGGLEAVESHADAVLNEITGNGNLILVHNTYADRDTIKMVKKRENLYWCLCPRSNLFIENEVPPVSVLMDEGCTITVGTDSLASNTDLNLLEELKTLQENFTFLTLDELIPWATLNGAKALQMEAEFGKIEKGKKPGLLLLEDADMQNMKLLPGSFVTRLA